MTRKAKPTAPNCITPKCARASVTRGLCANCYQTACKLIAKNEANWETLVELKLATDKQVKNPFLVAFNARRKTADNVSIPMPTRKASS